MTNPLDEIKKNLEKIQQAQRPAAKALKTVPYKETTIPTKVKKIKRQFEHDMFILWRKIPVQWKGNNAAELASIGVEAEDMIRLVQCRSQAAFAKEFKVSPDTLSDWNRELKYDPSITRSYEKEFRILTQNLVMALYLKALKEGDPERLKAWMTFVEGWSPRETVIQTTTSFDIVAFMKEMRAKAEEEKAQLMAENPDRYE